MAKDYAEYLATQVINEGRAVSYRMLSRELNIHVNSAKEMLYAFHRRQNSLKPGSIHATYLLCGYRLPLKLDPSNGKPANDGEDTVMQSSPFMSSQGRGEEETLDIRGKTISVVREGDLEGAKGSYEKITSLHIYSLEPAPFQDLEILTDCNRELSTKYVNQFSVERQEIYGIIQNKDVKRRQIKAYAVQPPPIQSQKTQIDPRPKSSSSTSAEPRHTESQDTGQENSKASSQASGDGSKIRPKASVRKPSMKRDSSNIFQSFAKAKPKVKTEVDSPSASGNEQTDASKSHTPLRDDSDDDEDGDVDLGTLISSTKATNQVWETKKARQDRLRKMMDDDDEDEPMEDEEAESLPDETEESLSEAPVDPEAVEEEEPPAPIVSGGRRRGKRKVNKRTTFKDEEGFLVTKEEQVWESFSEDDAPAPRPSQQSAVSQTSSKKGASGKKGKGDITSFFSKK